ncbi:MAG: hypothetical protein MUF01_03375 [Bryobacterales bacterium]|jgi:hypothetical protein|nr:hypothetical protein [Bryobacterales bacterium]
MKNSFDLHLAHRLTESGLLTVVTDPQEADYILTEGVGPGFEEAMKRLYKRPEPTEPEKAKDEAASESDERKSSSAMVVSGATLRPSSFGRSAGTVFLVRRDDSTVIWSTFLRRHDSREEMLNKNAGEVVKRLKKRMAEEQKAEEQKAVMEPNP